jgi:hypothetical protein
VVEISEVNPTYDRDGITCKLAANIIVPRPGSKPPAEKRARKALPGPTSPDHSSRVAADGWRRAL